VADHQHGTGPAATSRPHQGPPAHRRLGLQEQQLDGAPGGVLGQHASGDHARVVDDETVARTQELGQIGHAPILQRAAASVDHQQAAAVARLGRRLRDRGGRQVVVEIAQPHRRECTTRRGVGAAG
jgi:hypothetical protein